jgi:hypothetical protein
LTRLPRGFGVSVNYHKVGGIALHIGARVASNATPGEVIVSNTVKDSSQDEPYSSTTSVCAR